MPMARTKPTLRPQYQQTSPDQLVTAEQLKALEPKPRTNKPNALLEYSCANASGLRALYDQGQTVPAERKTG